MFCNNYLLKFIECPHYCSFLSDVDECSDGSHNCTNNQICENTDGGFKCLSGTVKPTTSPPTTELPTYETSVNVISEAATTLPPATVKTRIFDVTTDSSNNGITAAIKKDTEPITASIKDNTEPAKITEGPTFTALTLSLNVTSKEPSKPLKATEKSIKPTSKGTGKPTEPVTDKLLLPLNLTTTQVVQTTSIPVVVTSEAEKTTDSVDVIKTTSIVNVVDPLEAEKSTTIPPAITVSNNGHTQVKDTKGPIDNSLEDVKTTKSTVNVIAAEPQTTLSVEQSVKTKALPEVTVVESTQSEVLTTEIGPTSAKVQTSNVGEPGINPTKNLQETIVSPDKTSSNVDFIATTVNTVVTEGSETLSPSTSLNGLSSVIVTEPQISVSPSSTSAPPQVPDVSKAVNVAASSSEGLPTETTSLATSNPQYPVITIAAQEISPSEDPGESKTIANTFPTMTNIPSVTDESVTEVPQVLTGPKVDTETLTENVAVSTMAPTSTTSSSVNDLTTQAVTDEATSALTEEKKEKPITLAPTKAVAIMKTATEAKPVPTKEPSIATEKPSVAPKEPSIVKSKPATLTEEPITEAPVIVPEGVTVLTEKPKTDQHPTTVSIFTENPTKDSISTDSETPVPTGKPSTPRPADSTVVTPEINQAPTTVGAEKATSAASVQTDSPDAIATTKFVPSTAAVTTESLISSGNAVKEALETTQTTTTKSVLEVTTAPEKECELGYRKDTSGTCRGKLDIIDHNRHI